MVPLVALGETSPQLSETQQNLDNSKEFLCQVLKPRVNHELEGLALRYWMSQTPLLNLAYKKEKSKAGSELGKNRRPWRIGVLIAMSF